MSTQKKWVDWHIFSLTIGCGDWFCWEIKKGNQRVSLTEMAIDQTNPIISGNRDLDTFRRGYPAQLPPSPQ